MKFKLKPDHLFMKEELDQDMMERKQRRAGWYRKYANLEEGAAIDMNNLDEWALNAAGCEGRCSVDDIKEALQESILTEAPASNLTGTLKQAADEIEAKEVASQNQAEGQIEKVLDRALKVAKRTAGKEGVSYPNVLFISEAGMGKAQPLTSKVYTPSGYKLMGDIQPGDEVLDGKGRTTTVAEVFPQGKRDIYRLNLSDGTYIEVADNHLNSVYRIWDKRTATRLHLPIKEDMVVTTLELKKLLEDQSSPTHKYGKPLNPSIWIEPATIYDWEVSDSLPIHPYLLGCLLGDGCLGQKTGLMFSSLDNEVIQNISVILAEDWKIELHKLNKCDYSLVNFKENKYAKDPNSGVFGLRKALNDLGLRVNSEDKFIPVEYLYSSYEDRLALLQGLMDTDGTVEGPHYSTTTFTTVSEKLFKDVAFLVRSLGCRATGYRRIGRKYHYITEKVDEWRSCKDSYICNIGIPEGFQLFRLTRKQKAIKHWKDRPHNRRKVTSIEFNRQDKCQCIYVDSPEHTYITDNLTITHNTSICRAWARANGVNLVEVRGSTLDPTDIGGLFASPEKGETRAKKISTGIFEPLEQPNSVLFLDEMNRANKAVRNALLELINSHYLPDPNNPQGGQRFLPNFLFTIATINPPSGEYNADALDPAEASRFRNVNLTSDNKYILKYLEKIYTEAAEKARKDGDNEEALENEGRKKLAQTLLNSKRFTFDDSQDIMQGRDKLDYQYHPLNYRSLNMLLDTCDGTKDDFLDLWNDMCNPLKKSTIEGILSDYVDVDDKANDALKGSTESDIFKKKLSPLDKLKGRYPELNF